MVNLAGVIHPTSFKVNELVTMMGALVSLKQRQGEIFRHKNLELSIWGGATSIDEKNHRCAMIDGRIFNFDELKKELPSHLVPTNQAELLLHAYETWGEAFLEKLNGFFAIALFDPKKEVLLLARDPIGKKNLYFSTMGGYFLFATEIKGLLSTGIVPQTPAIEGLSAFLYFGYCPQDLTPIKGIVKLLPGHFLKVNLNRQTSIGQHWSYSRLFEEKKERSREEIYQELGSLLKKVVLSPLHESRSATQALPHVGSALLLALLTSLNKNTTAISAFLEGTDLREIEETAQEIKQAGVPSITEKIPIEQALADMVKVVWHQDEPIADPTSLQIWQLAQLVSQRFPEGKRTLYAPLGWEEIAAGRERYFIKNIHPSGWKYKIAHLPTSMRENIVFPLLTLLHSDFKYSLLRNIDINRPHMEFLSQVELFHNKERKRAASFLYPFFNPEVFTQRFHRMSQVKGEVDPFLYFVGKTELPDKTLMQYERLCAPFEIELMTPFLDTRLLQFFARVPEHVKIENKHPGIMLKRMLHQLAPLHSGRAYEPPPYPSFIESWRHDQPLREIFSQLKNGLLVQEGIISAKWIKEQLGYPYLIPRTFLQLWAILVLEIWFHLFISRPIGSVSLETPLREIDHL